MILSNCGYNAYDINKIKKVSVRMENSGDIDNLANGINDVSLVPAFQMILISHSGLDS
jgi:hypothetical protein